MCQHWCQIEDLYCLKKKYFSRYSSMFVLRHCLKRLLEKKTCCVLLIGTLYVYASHWPCSWVVFLGMVTSFVRSLTSDFVSNWGGYKTNKQKRQRTHLKYLQFKCCVKHLIKLFDFPEIEYSCQKKTITSVCFTKKYTNWSQMSLPKCKSKMMTNMFYQTIFFDLL